MDKMLHVQLLLSKNIFTLILFEVATVKVKERKYLLGAVYTRRAHPLGAVYIRTHPLGSVYTRTHPFRAVYVRRAHSLKTVYTTRNLRSRKKP